VGEGAPDRVPGREQGLFSARACPDVVRWFESRGKKLAKGLAIVRNPTAVRPRLEAELAKNAEPRLADVLVWVGTEPAGRAQLPCPSAGGEPDRAAAVHLMFETHVGAVRDEESEGVPPAETAQGMFYNFKNVLDSTRVKIPFGICQVGRAFRNEVTPRNYIFRSREFEQMELEFFVHPSEADKWYRYWRRDALQLVVRGRTRGKNLRLRDSCEDELRALREGTPAAAATSSNAFPFSGEKGFTELEGIAYRSDYDLKQHAKASAWVWTTSTRRRTNATCRT